MQSTEPPLLENEPAGHIEHSGLPSVGAKVPGPHSVHSVALLGDVDPALQEEHVKEAKSGATDPALHTPHSIAPSTDAALPGAHASQIRAPVEVAW